MGKYEVKTEEKEKDPKVQQVSRKDQFATPNGCGQAIYEKQNNRYGHFKEGIPNGLGCIEVKGQKSTIYVTGIFKDANTIEDRITYEVDRSVYFGELDKFYQPHDAKMRVVFVNQLNSNINELKWPVFFEGAY